MITYPNKPAENPAYADVAKVVATHGSVAVVEAMAQVFDELIQKRDRDHRSTVTDNWRMQLNLFSSLGALLRTHLK